MKYFKVKANKLTNSEDETVKQLKKVRKLSKIKNQKHPSPPGALIGFTNPIQTHAFFIPKAVSSANSAPAMVVTGQPGMGMSFPTPSTSLRESDLKTLEAFIGPGVSLKKKLGFRTKNKTSKYLHFKTCRKIEQNECYAKLNPEEIEIINALKLMLSVVETSKKPYTGRTQYLLDDVLSEEIKFTSHSERTDFLEEMVSKIESLRVKTLADFETWLGSDNANSALRHKIEVNRLNLRKVLSKRVKNRKVKKIVTNEIKFSLYDFYNNKENKFKPLPFDLEGKVFLYRKEATYWVDEMQFIEQKFSLSDKVFYLPEELKTLVSKQKGIETNLNEKKTIETFLILIEDGVEFFQAWEIASSLES